MAKHPITSPSPPSPEPGTVLFETERLLVRRYLISDAAALAEIGNDPEVAAFMSDRFPNPYTLEDAESFISNLRPVRDEPMPKEYPTATGVFLKPGGDSTSADGLVLIGSIGVRPRIDVFYRSWAMGYFFGRKSWGNGYATEAVSGFVRWIFKTWPDLIRVEACRFSPNIRCGRVLERSGFVFEGVKRSAVEKNGVILDEVVYGVLRSELKDPA